MSLCVFVNTREHFLLMQKDCNTVWANCLEIIKEDVADQGFNTWFMPIVPLKLDGKSLTIQVPSQFFFEWLEEHYIHVLKKALSTIIGEGAKLEYSVIVDQGNKQNAPYVINLPNRSVGKGNNYRGNERRIDSNPFHLDVLTEPQESQLNQAYSFDSFIEGDCNRLARSAGYAVAKKPGITSFNPLMIYGGVGLGKTHLVNAVGHYVLEQKPNARVLYLSAECFTNEFIWSLQNGKMSDFRDRYRNRCDRCRVQRASGRGAAAATCGAKRAREHLVEPEIQGLGGTSGLEQQR